MDFETDRSRAHSPYPSHILPLMAPFLFEVNCWPSAVVSPLTTGMKECNLCGYGIAVCRYLLNLLGRNNDLRLRAPMKRICAWCKKDLDPSSTSDGTGDAPITHGICSDCARETLAFKAKPLRKFLDQFSKPVFLVSSEGRIVTGNSAGFSLLKRMPEEVEGELGGDAFGCSYAELEGGCGSTIHCKTCTIRITVFDTLQSGKSHIGVPAYPDLHHVTGENRIRFLITTEKMGDAVLLRIDEVTEVDSRQCQ